MAKGTKYLGCACCGTGVMGRQWYNRDTGYGVCKSCADANTERYGEGSKETSEPCDSTTYSLYGVRGYHFSLEEERNDSKG